MMARNNRFLLLREPSGRIVLRECFSTRALFERMEKVGMPRNASLLLRHVRNRLHMEEYSEIALRRDMTMMFPGEGKCFLQFVKASDSFEIVNPREARVVATVPYDQSRDTLSNILSIQEAYVRENQKEMSATLSAEPKRFSR